MNPSLFTGHQQAAYETISPALFDAYFDLGLVSLVFFVVSIDSFWSYKISSLWIIFFILASGFLIATIFILYKNLNKKTVDKSGDKQNFTMSAISQGGKRGKSMLRRVR